MRKPEIISPAFLLYNYFEATFPRYIDIQEE